MVSRIFEIPKFRILAYWVSRFSEFKDLWFPELPGAITNKGTQGIRQRFGPFKNF